MLFIISRKASGIKPEKLDARHSAVSRAYDTSLVGENSESDSLKKTLRHHAVIHLTTCLHAT
jgi:hypothetical protein